MIIRETTSPIFLDASVIALPVIGYDNLVDINNITATTEDADFPLTNLANPATHLKWKEEVISPASSSDIYLTITIPQTSPETLIDYIAIAGHNFGTIGSTVSIETTTDASSPVTGYVQVSSYTPTDDTPIIFQFDPQTPTFARIKITAGTDFREAAVIYAGTLLTLERGVKVDVDHVPINLGRNADVLNGMSESGNFLGRIMRNQINESRAEISFFSNTWYRTYFDPFIVATLEIPFFFAWAPNDYPTDTGFCWLTESPIPEMHTVLRTFSVTLNMRAIA